MKFNMGDDVYWYSQAAGHVKHKEGSIVEIVAAGDKPKLMEIEPWVKARNHESYVVWVKSKLYWPLVRNLNLSHRSIAPTMVL